MRYVALLRGINVGGKNKVEMARLREVFDRLGHQNVRTYINSGNVVFDANGRDDPTEQITAEIAKEFGFRVEVLVKDLESFERVVRAVPGHWVDDKTMRTYVMFLWEDYDVPSVVDSIPIKENIDNVIYVEGAIIWQVDREYLTRSGMSRFASTTVYKSITARSVNTVRTLAAMMATEPDD